MPIRPREYLRQKNLEFKASLGTYQVPASREGDSWIDK